MRNYNRGLIKQIEELTTENEQLKQNNSQLRAENRELRRKIESLESTIEDRIAKAVELAVAQATKSLLERIAFLEKENAKKDAEIVRLKAQIEKDSSNSSKPPSSDGFKRVPNSREKSERKSGGQPGHKGSRLSIPKNLDDLVKEGKAKKTVQDHTDGAEKYVSVWEVDIEITPHYTEHRYPIGTKHGIHYGDNLKAICVLLSVEGIVAEKRLGSLIETVTHGLIKPSDAAIERFIAEAAGNIDVEEIKQQLLNLRVMHVDDTPMRCAERMEYDSTKPEKSEGTTFHITIRAYTGSTATLYTVSPHKDIAGVERDGILPGFQGIVSHDHDRKYYHYGTAHATCGAHLLRELRGLAELWHIDWAKDFREFYASINDYKNNFAGESCDPTQLERFEHRYDDLLAKGFDVLSSMKPNSFGAKQLEPILNRLRNFKDSYLLFIRNYDAPFTNNQAERDLRICKTKQKVSGSFRTWNGLTCYAKIRSFISTSKKQALDLFSSVKNLFPSPLLAAGE